MKKLLKILVSSFLLAALFLSLGACSFLSKSVASGGSSMDFGKKYVFHEETNIGGNQTRDASYIFRADHTGVCEYRYVNEDKIYPSLSYVLSGSVDFIWRESDVGSILLFKVEEHYNEEHTEGYKISLIDHPLYFGEDFFFYTDGNGSTKRYIKEGTELAELQTN